MKNYEIPREREKLSFEDLYHNMDINKFSWSSLSLYDACPQCYYLKYICGIKQKWVSANLILGTITHKLDEDEKTLIDPYKRDKLIDEIIESELKDKYLKGSSVAEIKDDAKKMAELLRTQPLIREDGSPILFKEKEAEAYVPMNTFVLHTKIDRITDRNEIIERKTSSIKYTPDTINESYQHVIYEMAFRHIVGVSSNGVIYDILYKTANPIREMIRIEVSEEEIQQAKNWINDLVTHINKKIWKPYKPIDRKHLSWCDYSNLCLYCGKKNHE